MSGVGAPANVSIENTKIVHRVSVEKHATFRQRPCFPMVSNALPEENEETHGQRSGNAHPFPPPGTGERAFCAVGCVFGNFGRSRVQLRAQLDANSREQRSNGGPQLPFFSDQARHQARESRAPWGLSAPNKHRRQLAGRGALLPEGPASFAEVCPRQRTVFTPPCSAAVFPP
eukprot:gene17582-biopygen9881